MPLSCRGAYITLRSKREITKAVVDALKHDPRSQSRNACCILAMNHLEQLPVIFLHCIMPGGNVTCAAHCTVHQCSQVRFSACIKTSLLSSCRLWRLVFYAVNGCKAAISPPQAAPCCHHRSVCTWLHMISLSAALDNDKTMCRQTVLRCSSLRPCLGEVPQTLTPVRAYFAVLQCQDTSIIQGNYMMRKSCINSFDFDTMLLLHLP